MVHSLLPRYRDGRLGPHVAGRPWHRLHVLLGRRDRHLQVPRLQPEGEQQSQRPDHQGALAGRNVPLVTADVYDGAPEPETLMLNTKPILSTTVLALALCL